MKVVHLPMLSVQYKHNVRPVNSVDTFLNIRGELADNIREVYFVRMIGESGDVATLIDGVDNRMNNEMFNNRLKYIRINELPSLNKAEDVQFYSDVYSSWKGWGQLMLKQIQLQGELKDSIAEACRKVLEHYGKTKSLTESMEKNFMVKLLFWMDSTLKTVLEGWNEKSCIKVLADNVAKEHEYLFYLCLTYLGCDVLLIQNRVDVKLHSELGSLSASFKIGEFGGSRLHKYEYKVTPVNATAGLSAQNTLGNATQERGVNRLVIPEHPSRRRTPQVSMAASPRTEKSFEELAQLASSIVLIAIHDSNGDVIGTGSGIMIGRNGYILTNNHVASGGRYYSVRIEDDDEVYKTNEVIKYNSSTDLAVIRIGRQLNPIPIYKGPAKLVRGQKVVAIGSPLGLFNSVSDGIISGFRSINDVDMIQFTAPISHGSSGGAVLNMYGEVVGISTAGIDSGQNINLAIGYESILMFAAGFMN